MKDPLGIMGTETIFVMESYHSRNIVEEFENMDNFKAGIVRKKHTLPYRYDGTGAVVYGPYLYYNRCVTPMQDDDRVDRITIDNNKHKLPWQEFRPQSTQD